VVTNYSKNPTVQPLADFSIPRETLNGFLKDETVYVATDGAGAGGVYTYVGEFEVYLNDTKINDLGVVQFREITPVSWLTLNPDGTFTILNPGVTVAECYLEARMGEFVVTEKFTLRKTMGAANPSAVLTTSNRRFYFDAAGVASPGGQTAVVTASGTNATTPWTFAAVDNLGNAVAMTGSGNSRTINISAVSSSPLVMWIRVVATSANNASASQKIIVQRGTDAYAAGILGALGAANEAIEIYYQNDAPTGVEVDDIWVDTNDSNRMRRWNGTVWVEFSDTRIVDALNNAAGAQATADSRIRTFFGESTPTATAIGDLWYRASTNILYRWDGVSWANNVATYGASWGGTLTGTPANLAALTGAEAINNQVLLNAIANDDVLSASEKLSSFIKLVADLESRRAELRARAIVLGLSTTALDTARDSWLLHLDGLVPDWNNTSVDTPLYTHLYPDKIFPVGWTGAGGASTSTNDAYTTVTDNSAAASQYISRIAAKPAITAAYSFGVVVKKDSVARTTRYPYITVYYGAFGFNIAFDTSTGAFATTTTAGVSWDAVGVSDLGDNWFVWGTFNVPSTAANIGFTIYPAIGANATLGSGISVATTGSISVLGTPLLTQGDYTKLGRYMLLARQYAYSNQLTAMARAVSEADATLSTWSGTSGRPANLAALVGTEAINNQIILNSIADDDVLSRTEKINQLSKLVTDLEARWENLHTRAVALGISVTAVNYSRTRWKELLASYSPRWDDFTADTPLYTHWLVGDTGPASWTNSGTTIVQQADGWWRVSDGSTGDYRSFFESQGRDSGQFNYAAGVKMKKESGVTHYSTIRMVDGFVTYDLSVSPATGAFFTGGGTPILAEVLDGGDHWYFFTSILAHGSSSAITTTFFPAGVASATATGASYIQPINVVTGGWGQLGRNMLNARLGDYSAKLTALARAISERDSATAVVIDPPVDVTIAADSTGTVKSDELPKVIYMKASIGTANVTTLGSWSLGSLPSGITANIGASTGVLTVTAYTASDVSIPVVFEYSDVERTVLQRVKREDDLPTTGGGGGGGTGGTTVSTATLAVTTSNSSATPAYSSEIVVRTGTAARVDFSAPIFFKRQGTAIGTTSAQGTWQIRSIGGVYMDVDTAVSSTYGSVTENDPDLGGTYTFAGRLTVTQSKTTGLAQNTDYQVRFAWWRVNGSGTVANVYKSNSNALVATGS
jgi:hypothetical protein